MKEKLYTIEVMDALKAGDECPCCYLERKIEQDTISFVLGASYMEDDIRAATDQAGFCRHHTKMMYDYGNSLGNAWILKTRMVHIRKQLAAQAQGKMTAAVDRNGPIAGIPGGKQSIFSKFLGTGGSGKAGARSGSGKTGNGKSDWMKASEETCYVCRKFEDTYGRIIRTFLHLIQTEPDFLNQLKASKGFCLPHFADLLSACEETFTGKEAEAVIPQLYQLMEENLDRIQADIDWFVDKFDYRNQDADWKTSKDAIPRTMQKLVGSYPSDPVFKQK
ncbi:MAG: DUF6062 family protein [Lachnospiraceae bacterium]|nr:DUF6062 family protein [Lachnospiraceae bacterium]